ncbi:MAG: UvrD-helicase domain-containing protein [Chthoniobacterales bacterium]|nr:UvrD-helicase domain-containing protein [Chthoniobacterales bacterium]
MLQLQRASAGSGKTEQLARRYLQIFFKPEHANLDPASVLATTFTREAAGEILARVFRLLARACEEESLGKILVEGTDLPIPTQETCALLLRRLVDQVDRLSIGTIDALFAQQARMLALDLGMASPWEIADSLTSEELAREALIRLLKTDPNIREAWSLLHHGTRTLSFVEKGTGLFERNRWVARAHPFHEELLQPAPPQFFAATENVKAFLKTFEAPLNKTGKPDGRWVKALQKMNEFFAQPLLLKDLLEGGALMRNCLAQGVSPAYCNISSGCSSNVTIGRTDPSPAFYGIPIPDSFINFFLPFLEASIQERKRLEALREAAFWQMIQKYESLRKEISFRAGRYTFSEVEEAVQVDQHHLSLEEIALRMDNRTEHLLLDEYQDTSQRQHDFLSPLVGNVLAKGGDVFVVGDVKQGIYGWRGGKRHLLSLLEQEHHIFKKEMPPLNQSYRSSRAVLEGVNEVFGALKNESAVMAMEGGAAFEKAAVRWSADFQPHIGASSVADLRGRVRLHAVAENENEPEEPMRGIIEKAVMLVEEHLEEDPLREVAILVRRTKLIPPLLQRLREREIVASGEGGNPLTDTLAVELLLSLLIWIDHPGHTAAYEHVFHSPLRDLVDQKNAALSLRQQLLNAGYAPTLRSWAALPGFQAACSPYERGRLEQLMALAESFDAAGGGRPSSLMKRVRNERVESPLPANVRVLTFHAAKGLEFESVILMDLDVDITAGGEQGLRLQQDEEGYFFIQGSQETMALQGRSELLAALQEEQWAEMLSLLYVGMTRAASYLDLLLFEKPTRKKTMAQWLRASGLQVHEAAGSSLRSLKKKLPAKKMQMPLHRPSIKPHQKLSQRHPSEEQDGGVVSLGQLLQGRAAREKGTAMHAELAEIEWEVSGSLLSRGEVFQKQFFLKRWKKWEVTQLELWRERRFVVVKEKELINGIFDRVVIGKNEAGIPMVAEVIDFKTGAPSSEQEKLYEPQLKAYRGALQQMLPTLEEITTRLVWVEENYSQIT